MPEPQASPPADLGFLSWMEGHWQALDEHGHASSEEIWRVHDGRLMGSGRSYDRGLLRGTEWLEIAELDGQIVYTAWPQGQDPVGFVLLDAGEQVAVFQNLQHDFPQVLDYRREGDRLRADLRGRDGAHLVIEWDLASD